VGREAELEQLRQTLARAGAGQGQVVAGVGEAGVGKSRLLYEFIRSHHTHGWLLLASHSVSYGKATAYLPVLDLLKGYFQIAPQDDARRMREKVTGKLLTLDRALEPTLPALLALLEVPVDDPQWQAFDSSATPSPHPRCRQAPAAAGKPGAAALAGLRGSALD
jgi:predicted ATPase